MSSTADHVNTDEAVASTETDEPVVVLVEGEEEHPCAKQTEAEGKSIDSEGKVYLSFQLISSHLPHQMLSCLAMSSDRRSWFAWLSESIVSATFIAWHYTLFLALRMQLLHRCTVDPVSSTVSSRVFMLRRT